MTSLLQTPKTEASETTPRQTVTISRTTTADCRELPPEQISEVLKDPDVLVWVDLVNPSEREITILRDEFGFHRLAIEDVLTRRQRPKVDEYPGYFLVVLHALAAESSRGAVQVTDLGLFIGKNYLVTCHTGESAALGEAAQRWMRAEPELRSEIGFLVHVVVDAVVDSYLPIVDGIEDQLDDIERAMFENGNRHRPARLLLAKRNLYTLRKSLNPLREVFNTFLRRDHSIFSAETYPYFQDAYDHVLRLLDLLEMEREMSSGIMEAQFTLNSNRLNEAMRRLTVIALCVAILGAVFGAWGMNFSEVPLHSMGLRGFGIVVGGTLLTIAVIVTVARRIRLI